MELQIPNATEREEIVQEICHANSPYVSSADFEPFLQFYMETCTSDHFLQSEHGSAFRTHADIIKAVSFLRQNASLSKTSFQDQAFGDTNRLKKCAARMTVKIAFMIDCASRGHFSDRYQLCGSFPVKWTAAQNFVEFLEGAFPTTNPRPFHARSSNRSIKAWKLKERYGIRFKTTDDLVQHLLYDSETSSVWLFRQAAFIKAHLSHTEKFPLNTGFGSSVQSGSLPPQLLLETLLTLYDILLPVSTDPKSAEFTKYLVKESKFDPNLMRDDGSIRKIPSDFKYVYWGERLRILEDITRNPPPSNRVVSWIERHTSERNALTVAIIGVFLAVFFGFLSFIVGIAQLVVSILAWKYPAAAAP